MKIDLCKLLGVEEGEEFKIKPFGAIEKYKVVNKYRFKNCKLEYYSDCIDKWQDSVIDFNTVLNSEIIKLKKNFSQDTLNFFKCIDKEYKWIAKDKNGTIYLFGSKPLKEKRCWFNGEAVNVEGFNRLDGFKDNLFDEILWEDEEAVHIDDYVER